MMASKEISLLYIYPPDKLALCLSIAKIIARAQTVALNQLDVDSIYFQYREALWNHLLLFKFPHEAEQTSLLLDKQMPVFPVLYNLSSEFCNFLSRFSTVVNEEKQLLGLLFSDALSINLGRLLSRYFEKFREDCQWLLTLIKKHSRSLEFRGFRISLQVLHALTECSLKISSVSGKEITQLTSIYSDYVKEGLCTVSESVQPEFLFGFSFSSIPLNASVQVPLIEWLKLLNQLASIPELIYSIVPDEEISIEEMLGATSRRSFRTSPESPDALRRYIDICVKNIRETISAIVLADSEHKTSVKDSLHKQRPFIELERKLRSTIFSLNHYHTLWSFFRVHPLAPLMDRRLSLVLEKDISNLKLRYIGIIEEYLSGPLNEAWQAGKSRQTSQAAESILAFYDAWEEYIRLHKTMVFNDEDVMMEILRESKGLILSSYEKLNLSLSTRETTSRKASTVVISRKIESLEADLRDCFVYKNLNLGPYLFSLYSQTHYILEESLFWRL